MKFTMTTILAAALATVSSAAAVPSAVVPFPASFNLRVTTATRGTALEPYLGLVYSESYIGQSLLIGPNLEKVAPSIYNPAVNSGVTTIIPGLKLLANLLIVSDIIGHNYPMGWLLNWAVLGNEGPGKHFFSGWASGDFVQVNNAFAYDARDGKGPQTLWKACADDIKNTWAIFWNPPTNGCIPVDLTVVKV